MIMSTSGSVDVAIDGSAAVGRELDCGALFALQHRA
jgi:hypothetical protein